MEEFFSGFKKLSFKKGQTILRAGDSPPGIFYLKSGNVRMYSVSESGAELTLNIFKPKTFFPLIWAIGEIPNGYFFEAMGAVEAYLAPKSQTLKFLKKHPPLLFDVTRRAFVGLYGISARLESLAFDGARSKVLSTLLMLKKRSLSIPLTHQEIAVLSGTTRETTSRQLKNLEKQRLIKKRKRRYKILI